MPKLYVFLDYFKWSYFMNGLRGISSLVDACSFMTSCSIRVRRCFGFADLRLADPPVSKVRGN